MAEAPPAYGLPEQFMGQSQPILLPPGLVPLPPGYFPPGFVPPGFPVGPNGVPLPMSPPLLNPATGEIVFLPAFAPPPFAPGGESLPPGQFPPAFFPPLGIDPNAPMMQSGFPIQGAPAPAIQLNKVEQAPAPISLDKAPEFREPEFCGASSNASRNNSEIGWANATKVIGPENKYGKMISSTLNSEKRRITNENLTWLYYWTGANVLEDSPNLPDIAAYTAKFNARLKFLKDSWNDEHFRPFETISSAEMIIRARQLVYLMRLSTSTPGCITASRWNDQYNQPSHKRFEIDSYSRLIGDNQVFSNITDFSKSFGAALQKS